MEKSVDLLALRFFFFVLRFISETFFIKGYGVSLSTSVSSIYSMYDGRDTPYGSNKMKINKEGSLDV